MTATLSYEIATSKMRDGTWQARVSCGYWQSDELKLGSFTLERKDLAILMRLVADSIEFIYNEGFLAFQETLRRAKERGTV